MPCLLFRSTDLVGVDGLKAGFDLSECPSGFFAKETCDVCVKDLSVGEVEGNVEILIFDDFVLDQSVLQSILGVDLSEFSEILQSCSLNKFYLKDQATRSHDHSLCST